MSEILPPNSATDADAPVEFVTTKVLSNKRDTLCKFPSFSNSCAPRMQVMCLLSSMSKGKAQEIIRWEA